MKTGIIIAGFLLSANLASAEKTKNVEKHVATTPQQRIEISGISGSDITFRSWDKDEVYIKLTVRISSSDPDYESGYTESVKINEVQSSDVLRLTVKETEEKSNDRGSWFSRLFRSFYVKKEVSGEVYVPKTNPFTTDLKYGSLKLNGMQGELRLLGSGNSLALRDCPSLLQIENDYGTTLIENCGGNLGLSGSSSEIRVTDFSGSLRIEANYSPVALIRISQDISVTDRGGDVTVDDCGGDVMLDANYSTVTLNRVRGFATVQSASGTIRVRSVGGVQVKADYSTISINDVDGKLGRPVFVRSRSGELTLEDIIGDVQIVNPYSSIDLKRIKGNVNVATTSGQIDAEDVTGNWSSQTEYTSMNLRSLSAKSITISNSSNLVMLALKTLPELMAVQNKYGSVHINMPTGFVGDVELDAEYGSIDTNLPVAVKSRGGSAFGQTKIGSGPGSISIKTTSGNIDVTAR